MCACQSNARQKGGNRAAGDASFLWPPGKSPVLHRHHAVVVAPKSATAPSPTHVRTVTSSKNFDDDKAPSTPSPLASVRGRGTRETSGAAAGVAIPTSTTSSIAASSASPMSVETQRHFRMRATAVRAPMTAAHTSAARRITSAGLMTPSTRADAVARPAENDDLKEDRGGGHLEHESGVARARAPTPDHMSSPEVHAFGRESVQALACFSSAAAARLGVALVGAGATGGASPCFSDDEGGVVIALSDRFAAEGRGGNMAAGLFNVDAPVPRWMTPLPVSPSGSICHGGGPDDDVEAVTVTAAAENFAGIRTTTMVTVEARVAAPRPNYSPTPFAAAAAGEAGADRRTRMEMRASASASRAVTVTGEVMDGETDDADAEVATINRRVENLDFEAIDANARVATHRARVEEDVDAAAAAASTSTSTPHVDVVLSCRRPARGRELKTAIPPPQLGIGVAIDLHAREGVEGNAPAPAPAPSPARLQVGGPVLMTPTPRPGPLSQSILGGAAAPSSSSLQLAPTAVSANLEAGARARCCVDQSVAHTVH